MVTSSPGPNGYSSTPAQTRKQNAAADTRLGRVRRMAVWGEHAGRYSVGGANTVSVAALLSGGRG